MIPSVPLARSTDPQTSHDAAAAAVRLASSHRAAVLAVLRAEGPLSPEQIGDLVGLDAYAVRKCLPELQREYLAFPTGETVPTRAGRRQRVLAATV